MVFRHSPHVNSSTYLFMAVVAEWLRRWTRNPLGSARAGSNPADCACFSVVEARKLTHLLSCDGLKLPSMLFQTYTSSLPLHCRVCDWWWARSSIGMGQPNEYLNVLPQIGIFRLTCQITWMLCLPLLSPVQSIQILDASPQLGRLAQLVRASC